MPKRPLETTATMPTSERIPPVKAQKTERSHEENQERAYIAASRRADRSLEARVQSARMASEIHRRRTGRGLKVTEEIVIKEEMYEEEEDDMPRQFRYLTQHLQTNSPAMNHRVNAYVTTQAAMATMARYNEVNRLFSESFPSAAAYQQHLNQSMYMAPLVNNGNSQFTPSSPTVPSPTIQNESSPYGNVDRRISSAGSTPNVNTSVSSPPPLSPTSGTIETPESRTTPYQTPSHTYAPLDPRLQHPTSSFTSELPNELKMLGMANIDMNDPMAPYYFGGNPGAYPLFGDRSAKPELSIPKAQEIHDGSDDLNTPRGSLGHNDEPLFSPLDGFNGQFDNFNTSGGGFNDNAWDNLIDFGSEQ